MNRCAVSYTPVVVLIGHPHPRAVQEPMSSLTDKPPLVTPALFVITLFRRLFLGCFLVKMN